ncbi:MAG: hypothetical protein R6U32_06280 [Candidatus Woesearchaeota archaeon]
MNNRMNNRTKPHVMLKEKGKAEGVFTRKLRKAVSGQAAVLSLMAVMIMFFALAGSAIAVNETADNTTEETECTDSDNGKDYYNKGTVKAGGVTATDMCLEYNQISENYCMDGGIGTIATSCPDGTACKDGACIREDTISGCEGLSEMDSCLDDSSCYWDQETDACYDYTSPSDVSCTDPDGGRNQYVQGHTFGFRTYYANERDKRIRTGGKDYCRDETRLLEHYCSDGYIKKAYISCPSGCNNGVCEGGDDKKCTDSDNGKDYYTKGTIDSTGADGKPFTNTDRCMPSDAELFPGMLEENYCRFDGMAEVEFYDCPNGCKDGACILDSTAQPVEETEEEVKCVFDNSGSRQRCYSDEGGCSGIESCKVKVTGEKGKSITWKSTCGDRAYTHMDGNNERIGFRCGQEQACPSIAPPRCPNGTLVEQGEDENGCRLPPECVVENNDSPLKGIADVWSDQKYYEAGEMVTIHAKIVDADGTPSRPAEGTTVGFGLMKMKSRDSSIQDYRMTPSFNSETGYYEARIRAPDASPVRVVVTASKGSVSVRDNDFYFKVTDAAEQTAASAIDETVEAETEHTGEMSEESAGAEDRAVMSCTNGCSADSRCLPIGTRIVINGESSFCGITEEFNAQKEDDAQCQNNFECLSNQCSNGHCVDLEAQLKETRGMLEKIMGWLKGFFS